MSFRVNIRLAAGMFENWPPAESARYSMNGRFIVLGFYYFKVNFSLFDFWYGLGSVRLWATTKVGLAVP